MSTTTFTTYARNLALLAICCEGGREEGGREGGRRRREKLKGRGKGWEGGKGRQFSTRGRWRTAHGRQAASKLAPHHIHKHMMTYNDIFIYI
jgi:hypothetical protein